MNWLVKQWYNHNPLCYLLVPFSFGYRAVIFSRRILYRLGLKKVTNFPIPIIVIGNITVGGTGKTPLIIWLANYLTEQGYRPGIVSRGYGGNAKQYPQLVTKQSDATIVGDEALLIAEKTHCPVVVDPQRVNAVKFLLEKTNCNIVLSDDGLQHYALGRNLEIAVIDSARGFGNQFCLPAGPLREPIKRLSSVNFIISNGSSPVIPRSLAVIPRLDRGIHPDCHASESWHPEISVGKSRRESSCRGEPVCPPVVGRPHRVAPTTVCQQPRHNFFCRTAPSALFSMCYNFEEIYNLFKPELKLDLQSIKNNKIHAVAGIGNPQRFFNSLRDLGFSIIEHSFSDHHSYKKQDLEFSEDAIVIMTEKDAVKCKKFADERFWCLPISASLPNDFAQAILKSLNQAMSDSEG